LQRATTDKLRIQLLYTFEFKYGRTVNAHVSCAGGREFESQRLAKSYTALQTVCHRFNIYAGSCLGAMTRSWALQTRCTLQHSVASIMKCWVFGLVYSWRIETDWRIL